MRLILFILGIAGVEAPTGQTVVAERPLASMVSIAGGTFTMGATEEQRKAAVELCQREPLFVVFLRDPAAFVHQIALHVTRERDRPAEPQRAEP